MKPCNQYLYKMNSHLVLLCSDRSSASLWFRNGRVCLVLVYIPLHQPLISYHFLSTSVINAPTTGNTFSLFQNAAKALNGTSPPTPSGALNGSGAAASLLPGPLTGSIVGFDLPSGSAPTPTVPASSGASGAASGSGSAPNATKTASDASVLVASGFVGMVSALLGILLI